MSAPANAPQRYARLRAHRATGARRVVPATSEESPLLDRGPDLPALVDALDLDDVLRRTLEATVQGTDEYRRRPCG
ncbi:hypothetical protein [Streptomyces xantholiticus]|uniref:hypothetical protein n=1 Tax=Streptomyces xantholiticus TaxID=68285 RepID=UPI001673FA9D|nr:hypothetical protein [Streptomyces xantholiticus]GGW36468.1 hypothetical protein GCM10010381_21370 [Streptomyces xantholiticus]